MEWNEMNIGLLGFGKTGKAVASVPLLNPDVKLQLVRRKSHLLEHRSVPEFLGFESNEPGLIYSINKFLMELMVEPYFKGSATGPEEAAKRSWRECLSSLMRRTR